MITSLESPAVADPPLISLADIPGSDLIPRRKNGARLHISTLLRWIHRPHPRPRLQAVRVGGIWATRRDWLLAFFEACAEEKVKRQAEGAGAQKHAVEKKLRKHRVRVAGAKA